MGCDFFEICSIFMKWNISEIEFPQKLWVVVGCMGGVGGVIGVGGCRRGVAGVCGGIVGGRVHFVQNAFFTFKKCTST